jgi:hypothetical protein
MRDSRLAHGGAAEIEPLETRQSTQVSQSGISYPSAGEIELPEPLHSSELGKPSSGDTAGTKVEVLVAREAVQVGQSGVGHPTIGAGFTSGREIWRIRTETEAAANLD